MKKDCKTEISALKQKFRESKRGGSAIFFIMVMVLFSAPALATPSITYVSPTMQDNATTASSWVFVNATSNENLAQALLEWGNSSGFTNISMSGSSATNWYFNMSGVSDGTYNYTIWAQNTTGTWGQSARKWATVDTVAPYSLYACQDLSMQAASYILMQNVSSSGTCFTIKENNVALDGNGYTATYSAASTGYGVDDSAGYDNISVNNINLVQGSSSASSHGIYGSGMATSNITNNRITTSGGDSQGVYLYSSSNSNIVANNTITVLGSGTSYAVYVRLASSSNIISGNILSAPSSYPLVIRGASNSNMVVNNTISGGQRIYIGSESSANPVYNAIINNTIAVTGSLGAVNVYHSSAGNAYTTISGNTITSCGVDGCIMLWKVNSNTISDNNIAGSYGVGIYFSTSSSNNITNNRIIVSGAGLGNGFRYGSPSSNFINNTVIVTTSAGGVPYAISVVSNNKIMGGSMEITPGYYTYYLGSAGTTSSVINTNWTAARRIYFYDTTSWFNYNNETDGKIWLNTSALSAGAITRTLSKWKNSTMKWNDSASVTANYSLSGLLPNVTYKIENRTGGVMTNAYASTTNSNGDLPAFTIALNGDTEIRAYPVTPISVKTNATYYKLSSIAMINATIDRTLAGLTSPVSGALDIYVVSFNGSRFEAEINDSGTWTTGSISLANVITRTIEARWNTSQNDGGTYTVYAEFNYTDDGESGLQAANSSTFMLNPLHVSNAVMDVILSKAGIANITYGGSSMLGNGTYLLTSSTPVIDLYPTIAIITYPEGVYLKVYSNLSKIMVYSNHSFDPVLYLRPDFTNFYNGTANTFSGPGQQFNSIQDMVDVYSASDGVAVIGRNLNMSVYNTSYKEIRLYNVTDFEIYLHSGDYTSATNERNIYLNPAPVILGVTQELRGVSWERFQAISALSQDALKAGMDVSGVGFQVLFNETENYADIPSDRGVLLVKHPVSVLDRFGAVQRTYLGVAVWKTR